MTTALLASLAIAATATLDSWCPVESVLTAPACPFTCTSPPAQVRAIEADGVRHLAWLTANMANAVFFARQEKAGYWSYQLVEGPDTFGTARQIALDGDLLAVAWGTHVTIFRLVDGAWLPEAELTGAAANFASSVSVSAPPGGPERVVVGAASTGTVGPDGSAWVFVNQSGWQLEQTILAPGGLGSPSTFGRAVAIDGERVVVSAPSTGYTGALSVYERDGATWSLASSIAVPVWLEPQLGDRLALRGDTLAAVNGTIPASGGNVTTRVQVFHRVGDAWLPTALLQAEGAGTQLGRDLSMHADGDTVTLSAAAWRGAGNGTPVRPGAWMDRLVDGLVTTQTRLRNPKDVLDGPDVATPGAFVASGAAGPWAALSAPGATMGFAIRIVELDACPVDTDLNGDGVVDGADLGLLLGNWGGGGIGDIDGNDVVDGADLGLLLGAWS